MNVYILKDPNDLTVRYVGLTSKPPLHRMRMHIKDAKTKQRQERYLSSKEEWLLRLIAIDQRPIVVCLAKHVNKEVGIEVEKNIIAIYGRQCDGGTLYNVQQGGSYDSDKTTPWNRGLTGCYTHNYMHNMKINQSNRKDIYRFDKKGNLIDSWQSIRTMCSTLNFDRRTVQRCLEKRKNYNSHKGFMFTYSPKEVPIYFNNSCSNEGRPRYGKTSKT